MEQYNARYGRDTGWRQNHIMNGFTGMVTKNGTTSRETKIPRLSCLTFLTTFCLAETMAGWPRLVFEWRHSDLERRVQS